MKVMKMLNMMKKKNKMKIEYLLKLIHLKYKYDIYIHYYCILFLLFQSRTIPYYFKLLITNAS